METYLWKINKEKLNKTNLALYSDFIKKKYKISSDGNFNKIWRWSVDNPKIFWKSETSLDFAVFLSARVPVLRILRSFCPRARRFSGLCGLFVRARARYPDFADSPREISFWEAMVPPVP